VTTSRFDDESEPPVRLRRHSPRQSSLGQYFQPLQRGGEAAAQGEDGLDISEMTTDEELEILSLADQAERVAQQETPTKAGRGGNKRKRVLDSDNEDDDLFGDMSSGEERELLEITATAEKMAASKDQFVTPTKQGTSNILGLPTPSVSRILFPEAKRQRVLQPETLSIQERAAAQGTQPSPPPSQEASSCTIDFTDPTPGKSRDAFLTNIDQDEDEYEITEEIMALLKGQRVDDGVQKNVRAALHRSAMKTRGIAKGRDVVRNTLRMKDEKIAGLQERVAALENQVKAEKGSNARLKAAIAQQLRDLYRDW
jgi:hypothetical protein